MNTSQFVRFAMAAGTLSAATLAAHYARAQALTWEKEDAVGCARWISVGANDIPWIIGCGNTAADQLTPRGFEDIPAGSPDGRVYYLSQQCSPLCVDAWTEAPGNLFGNTVSVNINGFPYVTNSLGEVYYPATGRTTPLSFNTNVGGWLDTGNPAYAAAVAPLGTGCAAEFFTTGDCGYVPSLLYGVSPGGGTGDTEGTDKSVYSFESQLAAQQGAAGVQLAFFNYTNPQRQDLWLVTAETTLWKYDSGSDTFIQQQPGLGWVITDHYLLGLDGAVYQWDDASEQWFGPVLGSTPNGIWTIAYSSALTQTPVGTIGPSKLWAVDYSGDVYYAIPATRPPP